MNIMEMLDRTERIKIMAAQAGRVLLKNGNVYAIFTEADTEGNQTEKLEYLCTEAEALEIDRQEGNT